MPASAMTLYSRALRRHAILLSDRLTTTLQPIVPRVAGGVSASATKVTAQYENPRYGDDTKHSWLSDAQLTQTGN